jgi:RNA polymerase sigma-70 factor (ECF subfamily)
MKPIDAGLIRRAQQGDEAATRELVLAIQDDLYKFSFYLSKDRPEAEDLAQDAILKILKTIRSLQDPQKFKSWSLQLTKNLFLDRVRSRKPQEPADRLEREPDESLPDVELVLSVRDALQQLNENERTILVLVDLQGLEYEEAAEVLEIPVGTVKSRVFNARKSFMKIFGPK